jgi:hypothetical protein
MINVDIAFDDRDADLGDFFRRCKENLLELLRDNGGSFNAQEINSPLCNVVYLAAQMPLINANNFFFIAYSHGEIEYLLANDSAYVDSRDASTNIQLFANAFFYCVACLAGSKLGSKLVNGGAHVFIGYRGSFNVLRSQIDLSIELANFAIRMFLTGETVQEAFRLSLRRHEYRIDQLYRNGAVLSAGILVENRTSLVLIGRGDMTLANFVLA